MIGIFDSGFGGLTIEKEILKSLPQYDYIYLGDSARAPYGNKSYDIIYDYTVEAVDFLFKNGCKLVIIACNSASTKALRKIQQEWLPLHYPQNRVLGVIVPIAETVSKMKAGSKVGLIGTRATIKSQSFNHEINKINPEIDLIGVACPLLVPLVEEGWDQKKETKMILKEYLKPLKAKKVDSLILGCTHYPILTKAIKEIMGDKCKVLNSPKIVAERLKDYLLRHSDLEKKLSKQSKRFFYTTDEEEKFKKLGERYLGQKIEEVKKIEL